MENVYEGDQVNTLLSTTMGLNTDVKLTANPACSEKYSWMVRGCSEEAKDGA